MFFRNLLGVTSLSIALVACHGDGDHTSEPLSIASAAYQGAMASAVQTTTTASRFSKSAFAARDYALSATALSAYLPALDISGSETCTNGGSASQTNDIDQSTLLGSKTILFENCMVGDVLVDGSTILEVSAYDNALRQPTALKTTYNGLSQTKAGKTITLTGTVEATQNNASKTVSITIDTHMQAGTGEAVLTTMDIVVSGDAVKRSAASQYTGKVCLNTEGCVNITTQSPFVVEYNGYLTAGEMTSTGATNNTARIMVETANKVSVNLLAAES